MSMDYHYSYDFSKEIPVTEITGDPSGESLKYCGKVDVPASGEYTVLFSPFRLLARINDTEVPPQDRTLYYGMRCVRGSVDLKLEKGVNTLSFVLREKYDIDWVSLTLVPAMEKAENTTVYCEPFQLPEIPALAQDRSVWDEKQWRKGAGHGASPGRFGFTKGDGLLDCAMTAFGLVDKLYLLGHPKYDKPYRWGYCVLPGEEKAVLTGEKIKVNQLGVQWENEGVRLQYSLATPGILTECDNKDMKLSGLEFAGSYRYIMTSSRICTPEEFKPEFMTENFLLLFGSNSFPEVPLLVTLDRRPEKLMVERKKGHLSSLTFAGCRRMVTGTPFGMESLQSRTPADTMFLQAAARKCKLWSRAFMALPCDCKEYFRIDEEKELCHIQQHFSYRILQDEWNTEPLKIAPFPPAAALSSVAKWDFPVTDLEFPTKYGPLYGVCGERSSYTLPLIPYQSKFPLKDKNGEASSLLKKGMKEFFDFQEQFSVDTASYAYFGSTVERYGFAAMAFNLLDREDSEHLAKLASESLDFACDTSNRYSCLLTEHSKLLRFPDHSRETILAYYKDPAMIQKNMKFFYPRKEPYTGAEYYICYLNVSWLRANPDLTDEGISANPGAFIENDWGLGVAYYSLYMAMLASGNFEAFRKYFDSFCKMWDYLGVFHDWACMAAGYAENGVMWSEGANYCAYQAFINLARIAGDEEKRLYALYLGSQNMALRFAIYRSSQKYFHIYFDEAPYALTKGFREEQSPIYQFQGFPKDLDSRRLRVAQLHTFMTEGAFPDVLRHCAKFIPEDHAFVMKEYLDEFLDEERNTVPVGAWTRFMAPTLILLNMAEDPSIPESFVREKLQEAAAKNCLIGEWRDIGTFSTFHPVNLYPAMILAHLEARKHKLMLEHWEDVRITESLWEENKAVLEVQYTGKGKAPVIVCKVKEAPSAVSVKYTLQGKRLSLYPEKTQNRIEVTF